MSDDLEVKKLEIAWEIVRNAPSGLYQDTDEYISEVAKLFQAAKQIVNDQAVTR